jgi:hypothetical protein
MLSMSPRKVPNLQNGKRGGNTSFYDMKGGIIIMGRQKTTTQREAQQ